MVTGSRICGCSSKLRCDFSFMRGWQQMTNTSRWIKQFAEGGKVCRAYLCVAPINLVASPGGEDGERQSVTAHGRYLWL